MQRHWIHDTERYRYATHDDLPAFATLLSDPEVCRWLWFAPMPEEAVRGYFEPFIDRQTKQLEAGQTPQTAVFTVQDLEANFLGHGAVVAVDGSPGGSEIGFQLARAAWGRGVGTRLGRFLCAYAVQCCDAYRIEADCLEGNGASAGLLRKLGLKLEGQRPGYRLRGEVRHTELLFGREVRALDGEQLRQTAQKTGLAGG